jgi:hypothetical protein
MRQVDQDEELGDPLDQGADGRGALSGSVAADAPAQSQSTTPVHTPLDHIVLPCQRSPCSSTVGPPGAGSSLTSCSALASNGVAPAERRQAAKSTSGSGRVCSGDSGRGISGTA